jgi:hypothetical protein
MARTSMLSARNVMALATGACVVMAVTPTRYSGWTQHFSSVVEFFVTPVSSTISRLVRPAGTRGAGGAADSAELRQAVQDVSVLTTRNLQLQQENAELREQLRQLQRGLELNPGQDVTRVIVQVLSADAPPPAGSGLIKVRSDVRGGDVGALSAGAVAVHEGVNLVGRVTGSWDRVTDVRPITDPSIGELRATILTEPGGDSPLDVQLGARLLPVTLPVGARLRGPVIALRLPPGVLEPPVTPGLTVRLYDPQWPRAAQMLVIGTVESVERAENGRPIVTVRPAFDARASQLTLLLAPPSENSPGSAR